MKRLPTSLPSFASIGRSFDSSSFFFTGLLSIRLSCGYAILLESVLKPCGKAAGEAAELGGVPQTARLTSVARLSSSAPESPATPPLAF
eukprot:scaffold301_cov243-Pinguiococcus_pyrenoidosus.AAC.155